MRSLQMRFDIFVFLFSFFKEKMCTYVLMFRAYFNTSIVIIMVPYLNNLFFLSLNLYLNTIFIFFFKQYKFSWWILVLTNYIDEFVYLCISTNRKLIVIILILFGIRCKFSDGLHIDGLFWAQFILFVQVSRNQKCTVPH